MTPKFTLITHDFPPAKGGIARYLSSLVIASQGNIDVWVPMDLSSKDEFRVKKIKFRWSFWPYWLPLIKRCLEVPQENIILISHVFPIGTASWIANVLGGSEYAVIFHGTDLKRAQTKWKRWLLHRICNNAKLLIVNSQATEKLLKRLVPTANPLILTPGLDPFNLLEKSEARSRLNIDPDTKIILAVARLVERKGLDVLIQSVASLESRISNSTHEDSNTKCFDFGTDMQNILAKHNFKKERKLELVIVGDGPYVEPLHKLAELNGVNVRWIGNVSDAVLHNWYSASDIFCLPGRETVDDVEGFGIVFLEASYAGLPVIAGSGGGTSEAVINNQTGLLITPTVDACVDALQKLLDNPDLALSFGANGRERVLHDFNWSDRWQNLLTHIQPVTSNVKRQILNVSVVIPCYNHAFELRETLQSLLDQTISVKQVIVVDDGSNDNPEKVVQDFVGLLPISFLRLTQNSGAPVARNRGAKLADGEYIIYLDADITLNPEAIETMHQALLDNPDRDYVYCDFIWGNRLFRAKEFNEKDLQERNFIHTSALIRRRTNPVFDESLSKFQDWDLWLTMLESGSKGIYIPKILFSVKEHKIGISQWLPSFVYKIPWPIFGYTPKPIIKYRTAETIIRSKHRI